ncbi:MAG: sulfite exporter TauE/SafE family protein [Alphaproteobacteria bacterium]
MPPEFIPFAGIPLWAVFCVFAAHFIGFFIRGAFGFGSNMPIILMTTWLLGPHHAVVLVVVTASASQIHLLPQGVKTADWDVTRPLLAGMVVGVTFGTWVFTKLEADWLTLLMGGMITGIVVMDRLRLLERLTHVIDLRERFVSMTLALVSGLVGTISGGGGLYFLIVYLKLVCRTVAGLRGTNLILSGLFILVRVVLLIWAGFVSWSVGVEALLLLPVVLLGTWSGTRSFHAIDSKKFYDALQIVLLTMAVALAVKGAFRLL